MYKLLYSILFCTILVSSQAQSLDEYLQIAANNNAGLKSKFLEYQAALEKVPQLGSLPDPQVSFGYFITPAEPRMSGEQAEFSISQMFPWFGSLSAKKDAATSLAKLKYETFETVKNQVFFEVKQVYYELWQLERNLALLNENYEFLESYESLATTKYENGKVGLVDVIRVQLSMEEMQNDIQIMQLQKESILERFKALLNQEELELVIPLSLAQISSDIVLNDSLIKNNPSIKFLEKQAISFDQQLKVAKKSGLPSIGLGLSYTIMQNRGGMETAYMGKDMLMPKLTIGLPIYRKKYNAMQNEANLMLESVNEEKTNTQNLLLAEYKNAQWKYTDASKRIKLYENQIKKAESALNILITSYSSDNSDFEEVLRMQQQILEYQKQEVKAVYDLRLAIANLNYITGNQ